MLQDTWILWDFLKLLLALPFVLLLIYISLKFHHQYMLKYQQGKNMKIIERMPLSNKSFLTIVKVGKEYLILGVTENHMEVIQKLDSSEINEYSNSQVQIPLNEMIIKNLKKWKKEK